MCCYTELVGMSLLWTRGVFATRRETVQRGRPVRSTLHVNTGVGAPASHAHTRIHSNNVVPRRGENLWMDVVKLCRMDTADKALCKHYTTWYERADRLAALPLPNKLIVIRPTCQRKTILCFIFRQYSHSCKTNLNFQLIRIAESALIAK